MSDEYTPTTEEIAEWYSHKGGSKLSPHYARSLDTRRREFDAWLAKHDAEVAAKALEEAANAWHVNGWAHVMPAKGAERAQIILHVAQAATEMLRARAAEYRKAVD